MKRLINILISLLLLFSFVANAEHQGVKPQSQGDVTFVSGGVGSDEKDAMEAVRTEYNLHLLFAEGRGEYLSGVNVAIADSSNHIILETLSDGPMFFANLKPGRYTVSAEVNGRDFHKKINVGGKKATNLTFLWPN